MKMLQRSETSKPGIYKITNQINGKTYVGSSKDMYMRCANHLSTLKFRRHRNEYLQRSVDKYGIDNFEFVVLEFCPEEQLINREQYWIDYLNPDYNLIRDVVRHILSEESRLKLSQTLRDGYSMGRYKTSTVAVDMFSMQGELLRTFTSIKEAYELTDVLQPNIYVSCNSNFKTAGGYVWRYSGQPFDFLYRIEVFDTETDQTYYFNSCKDADLGMGFSPGRTSNHYDRNREGLYKDRYFVRMNYIKQM